MYVHMHMYMLVFSQAVPLLPGNNPCMNFRAGPKSYMEKICAEEEGEPGNKVMYMHDFKMTAESTIASDKLVDALQNLGFSEVQLEYGCELHEQSILEDPASPPPRLEYLIHTQNNLALHVSE